MMRITCCGRCKNPSVPLLLETKKDKNVSSFLVFQLSFFTSALLGTLGGANASSLFLGCFVASQIHNLLLSQVT